MERVILRRELAKLAQEQGILDQEETNQFVKTELELEDKREHDKLADKREHDKLEDKREQDKLEEKREHDKRARELELELEREKTKQLEIQSDIQGKANITASTPISSSFIGNNPINMAIHSHSRCLIQTMTTWMISYDDLKARQSFTTLTKPIGESR